MGGLLPNARKRLAPAGRALTITPHQALVRELILLLKRGYLDVGYFTDKFGVDIIEHWREAWDLYVAEGYATVTENRVELTRAGLLRVDALLPAFFEPEHQGVRYT